MNYNELIGILKNQNMVIYGLLEVLKEMNDMDVPHKRIDIQEKLRRTEEAHEAINNQIHQINKPTPRPITDWEANFNKEGFSVEPDIQGVRVGRDGKYVVLASHLAADPKIPTMLNILFENFVKINKDAEADSELPSNTSCD